MHKLPTGARNLGQEAPEVEVESYEMMHIGSSIELESLRKMSAEKVASAFDYFHDDTKQKHPKRWMGIQYAQMPKAKFSLKRFGVLTSSPAIRMNSQISLLSWQLKLT